MKPYREKIFERYASVIQKSDAVFDESYAERWGRSYDHFLRGWIPGEKDIEIVDIACGGGKLLYYFKKRGYLDLHGVDISREQVNLSQQVVEDISHGDAIEYMDKNPEEFDLITGLDIIEHFDKDEAICFMAAAYKALKPRGRLILQTPNAESPWGMQHRYNDITHEIGYNSFCLKKMFELAGFSDIEAREAGPGIHGAVSFVRFCLWKMIWVLLAIWNLVETGNIGSGIYTRIFFMTAVKL